MLVKRLIQLVSAFVVLLGVVSTAHAATPPCLIMGNYISVIEESPDGNKVIAGSDFVAKVDNDCNVIFHTTTPVQVRDIGFDDTGNIHAVGLTKSHGLPTTPGVLQPNHSAGNSFDLYIFTLSGIDGSTVMATYLGESSDHETSDNLAIFNGQILIAANHSGNNFSGEDNNGGTDILLISLELDGSNIEEFNLIGGSSQDVVRGMDINDDTIYLVASTISREYDITGGQPEVLVTILDQSLEIDHQFTYGGLGSDVPQDIYIDQNGDYYITGFTLGGEYFPTTTGTSSSGGGLTDIFIVKFNGTNQTMIYSSLFGGNGMDIPKSIKVQNGNAFVSGSTSSTDFLSGNTSDTSASFILKLSVDGNLHWGTLLSEGANISDFTVENEILTLGGSQSAGTTPPSLEGAVRVITDPTYSGSQTR